MFGQLWVAPDELPGLVDVDGEVLGAGEALAAWATAKVPSPLVKARPRAMAAFATGPRGSSSLIAFSPPGGVFTARRQGEHVPGRLSKR